MTTGEKIRQLRRERGLSQMALAKAADVAPATVWNIEADRCRPRPQTIEKIARVLNQQLGSESSAPKPKKQVRWVSVKERLPEKAGDYVCFGLKKSGSAGCEGAYELLAFFDETNKWECPGDMILTHWLDGLETPEEVKAWGFI